MRHLPQTAPAPATRPISLLFISCVLAVCVCCAAELAKRSESFEPLPQPSAPLFTEFEATFVDAVFDSVPTASAPSASSAEAQRHSAPHACGRGGLPVALHPRSGAGPALVRRWSGAGPATLRAAGVAAAARH